MKRYWKGFLLLVFLLTVLLIPESAHADPAPAFTSAPWFTLTGDPDEPYLVRWQTDIIPDRFEVLYWDGLYFRYVGCVQQNQNEGSWPFDPTMAGRSITIRAYYTNDSGKEAHVDSAGCMLKRDQMVFLAQPELQTQSAANNTIQAVWRTNFTPQKIVVRTYDSMGTVDFDTVTSGLSSHGSYPFNRSYVGQRFFINVYYGTDFGDYITSRAFTLTNAVTPVYWDGAGVRWSNTGYESSYGEIGEVSLYASENGNWSDAYQICSLTFSHPSVERMDFLHQIWNEVKEKKKDLYFCYGVKLYPRTVSYTVFSRINFAQALTDADTLQFNNASWGIWDDEYQTLYVDYLNVGVRRGAEMKITARPQEGKRFVRWICPEDSVEDDLTLKLAGAPFDHESKYIELPYFEPKYENTTTIHDVHFTVAAPVEGGSADEYTSAEVITVPESQQKGFLVDPDKTFWCLNSLGRTAYHGSFRAGQTYYLCTTISAKPGYSFYYTVSDSAVCSMNVTLHVGEETVACQAKTLTKVNDDLSISFVIPVVPVSPHTVSFNMNGHGTAIAPQYVPDGKTAVEPERPVAEGLRFMGWYTNSACTNRFYFSSPITADITLYARWAETIDSILIWADYPYPGKTPREMSVKLVGDTTGMRLQSVSWTYPSGKTMGDITMSDTDTFSDDKTYTMHIAVVSENSAYTFAGGITPYVNDEPAYVNRFSERSYIISVVCAPANVYAVSFRSEYGSPIPTQYVKEGARALEPENPVDPSGIAVFTGNYYGLVTIGQRPVRFPFSFDLPIDHDVLVELEWADYIRNIRLWVNSPAAGDEVSASLVSPVQGETGYSAEVAAWYADSTTSGFLEGTFESGQTCWFRIRVETEEGYQLDPSPGSMNVELHNIQADNIMFTRFDRNSGVIEGSYTVGSTGHKISLTQADMTRILLLCM